MADDHIQAVPGEASAAAALDKPPEALAKSEPVRPAPAAKKEEPGHAEPKDMLREIAETVVFVVVLVLLLKTFIAEAFVIPTGSHGHHALGLPEGGDCPQCGFTFPVNASRQVDPAKRHKDVVGCTCPNCLLYHQLPQ